MLRYYTVSGSKHTKFTENIPKHLENFPGTGKFINSTAGHSFQVKQLGLQLLNVGGDLGQRANVYNIFVCY